MKSCGHCNSSCILETNITYSASLDPWNNSLNLIFPTKYVTLAICWVKSLILTHIFHTHPKKFPISCQKYMREPLKLSSSNRIVAFTCKTSFTYERTSFTLSNNKYPIPWAPYITLCREPHRRVRFCEQHFQAKTFRNHLGGRVLPFVYFGTNGCPRNLVNGYSSK